MAEAGKNEDGGASGGRDARERRDPAGCTAEDPESAPRNEDRMPTAPPALHPPAAAPRKHSPPPLVAMPLDRLVQMAQIQVY